MFRIGCFFWTVVVILIIFLSGLVVVLFPLYRFVTQNYETIQEFKDLATQLLSWAKFVDSIFGSSLFNKLYQAVQRIPALVPKETLHIYGDLLQVALSVGSQTADILGDIALFTETTIEDIGVALGGGVPAKIITYLASETVESAQEAVVVVATSPAVLAWHYLETGQDLYSFLIKQDTGFENLALSFLDRSERVTNTLFGIFEPIPGIGDWIADTGRYVVDKVVSGLKKAASAVIKFFGKLF